MNTFRRPAHAAVSAAISTLMVIASAPPRAATYDNNELRNLITALGVTHNVAYPSALLPPPVGIVPGSIAYSTNLGLKYLPPVVVAPPAIAVAPNSTDGCTHTFFYPRRLQETRKDYLGLITEELPNDFGMLGRPSVFHFNTDVRVSARLADQNLQAGNVTLPAGRFSVRWQGDSLITPVLDYPPWYLLLGGIGAKDAAAKSGSQAGKVLLRQILINAAAEGAAVATEWFLLEGTPTPTSGPPIRNSDDQAFWVFDVHPPTIATSEPVVAVEATQVGGEFLRDHLSRLRGSITAADPCDRQPFVFHTGPDFMAAGMDHTITWTAQDQGPVNAGGGVNAVTVQQRVRVQDTLPPILLPPPGKVIDTTATTISTDVGRPGVFDLADVRVNITDDAPASYARNTRTRITWTATDASGNRAVESQWITVKQAGTNTVPQAQSRNLSGISFEPQRIELTGVDNDLLSGRFDQLSFALSRQPVNGFFVAPLFPFFIQDHRVENVFGLNPVELAAFLQQQCAADRNFRPPNDFVTRPRYITVGDTGAVYVSDQRYFCTQGSATTVPRLARFTTGADGRLQFTAQIETGGIAAGALRFDSSGRLYTVLPTGSGNSEGNLNIFSADLTDQEVIPTRGPTAPGSELVRSPYAVAADDQGVIYLTDGRVVNAYDLVGTRPNRSLRFLGSLADFDDLSTSGNFKDLALDSERNVYLSDSTRHRIWKFGASTYAGGGPTGFTKGALLRWLGRCTSNLTPALACDVANQRSFGFSCTDQLCGPPSSTAAFGSAPGQFNTPLGLAMSPSDVLYVADSANRRVQRFTRDGFFGGEAVSACPERRCFVLGDFGLPVHVTANSDHFYLLDQDRDILHVFKTTPITDIDDQTLSPTQSAFVTYQSNNNFLGNDSFQYTVSDGLATSPPANVNIALDRSHRPPVADAGLVFPADEDVAATLTLSGRDPDVWDQQAPSFSIVEPPAHGMLSGTGAVRTYTPDRDSNGDDQFTFTVSDGRFTSEPATAIVRVRPLNDLPVITVERPQIDVGVGYARTFQATLADPDVADSHRLVVDFGDGTVIQQGAAGSEVTIAETALGSAVLTARHTYTTAGNYTLRFCVSEGVPAPVIANCGSAGVRGIGSTTLRALAMADVAVAIDDSLPKTPDVAGIARSAPVMDGVPFTFQLTVNNAQPTGVAGLPALDTRMQAQIGDRLRVSAARTGVGSCGVSGQTIDCAFGTLASGQAVVVQVDVAGDGTVFEETTTAIAALLLSSTPDPSAASIGAREVTLTVDPNGDADGDGAPNRDDAFPGDPTESVDTDRDGVGNNGDTDDDNDTLPDVWETRYALDSLSVADGATDADGDTLTNANEFVLGTDPRRDDSDHDAHRDNTDNCPIAFNARQFDLNRNGVGDECDAASAAGAVRLADMNGNGAAEIAMLRADAAGNAALYVRDASTGRSTQAAQQLDPYREVNDFEALALERGTPPHAVAFLATRADGSVVADIIDVRANSRVGAHAYFDQQWTPIALAPINVAADTDIAVLARGPGGLIRVEVRSARTGALRRSIDAFSAGWTPLALAAISDSDGQRTPAIAVLAFDASGLIRVELLDPQSGARGSFIDFFNPDWNGLDLLIVPGANNERLALLASHRDGRAGIEVRDVRTGVLSRTLTPLDPGFTALDLSLLPELAGNSAGPELTVLASNVQGDFRAESRDLETGALVNSHGFLTTNHAPRGLVIDDSAALAIGVFATSSDGVLTVQLRNAASGALVRDLEAPGSEPAPPPMPPPPPSGGGGGGGGGGALGTMSLLGLMLLFLGRRRPAGNRR